MHSRAFVRSPRCVVSSVIFITEAAVVRDILIHLGQPTRHPGSHPPAARRWGDAASRTPRDRSAGPAGTGLGIRSAHCVVVPPQDRPPLVRDRSCLGHAPAQLRHRGQPGGPRPRPHRSPKAPYRGVRRVVSDRLRLPRSAILPHVALNLLSLPAKRLVFMPEASRTPYL